MEFRNLTPFDALCFGALDPDDREHPVVAMKVGYGLRRAGPGRLVAEVIDDDPVPLCTADRHSGEPGDSEVIEESDLAPYKPRCDVLIRGHSHAPGGVACREWEARVRISAPAPVPETEIQRPRPLAPGMRLSGQQEAQWRHAVQQAEHARTAAPTHAPVLDKTLRILGPREFRRRWFGGWSLTRAQAATRVPLGWERAFGGTSRVPNPKHDKDPAAAEYLLNEVCFRNPLGCGWIDARERKMLARAGRAAIRRRPAPQIEYPGKQQRALVAARHPKGIATPQQMDKAAAAYRFQPAGFGPLGRAWSPRLALAGTYDDAWAEDRSPSLPGDFDFTYWNAAPADQQMDFARPDLRIELWNLVDPALAPDGHATLDLPGHRPFVLMRMANGVMLPVPMLTDTVQLDTDAMILTLTHRISFRGEVDLRVLEARFETDPAAPLISAHPPQEVA